MDLNISDLYRIAIWLFMAGAVLSLVLSRLPKFCLLFANLTALIAAATLALASLGKLCAGGGTPLTLWLIQPTFPLFSIAMKVDDLSAFFLLSLAILTFCVSLFSIGYLGHYIGKRRIGLFHFLYLSFILSMILVFSAADSLFFYLVWEGMSLVSYFLVVFETEKEENQRAGTLYIIMTHLASSCLLIAFLLIYSYTGSFAMSGDTSALPLHIKNITFALLLIGFGTKAGVIPFHIWLPYAHPAAPSNVSALMSGIMIKTAIYGLVRFILGYLGVESAWWGSVVLFIGILSALLGVAYALMEHNIKRLLAFHSVENIGIILIGLGVSFMALAGGHQVLGGLALTAALLHTFNHALFKGGLFLGAGSMQYATGTKDIEKLGGLIRRMPVTACLVLCFSLAISALVPFNGFISEWLTYQALLTHILSEPAGMSLLSILAVAALGMTGALAAACFVKLFGISFLGLPRSSAAEQAREVPWTMGLGMGILAVLCLGIGLYPWGAVRLLDPVITGMLGSSTLGTLSGNLVLLVDRSALAGASAQSVSLLSPLIFLGILTAMIIISLMMIRIFGGRYIERRYGTWDCGFEALNARMQYSATGFSKPLRIVFRMLFRPSRLTTVEGNTYHPDAIHYSVSVISLFEEYMYHPLIRLSKRLSKSAKFHVQTGNIHTYLLYIFLAIIVLMLYYRLMPS